MDGIDDFLEQIAVNPIAACDLMLEIALHHESIEVRTANANTIIIEAGGAKQFKKISGVTGQFRSVLARLGNVFNETSKRKSGVAELNAVGRKSAPLDEFKLSGEWKVVDATVNPRPGSPLYNLDGTLRLEDANGLDKTVNVAMENSGTSQWCRLEQVL